MHSFGERCRASIGFLFFLLVPPLLTAQERSECNPANTQSIVKSALECYVLQQVRHGQPGYLQGRILRSEFLEELLRLAPSLKIHPPRVVIEEGVFNERLSFRNETVPLELHLSRCRFLRGVDFSLSHFLELGLDHSVFGAFDPAPDANFNGMKVDANLDLTHSEFTTMPTFFHLEVGGDLHAESANFYGGAVPFDRCKDRETTETAPKSSAGQVESNDRCYVMFDQSDVKGKLFLDRSQFDESLSLADITVRGLHLEDVSVKKDLKLSHARVETVIEIGLKGEPRWALLEGLTYQDLGSSDAGDRLRDLIKRHSPYFSSRAYLQLEEYYKNHGEVEKADDVFIDMKRHECGLLHGRAWLFSWLLYLLVGYGRHPEYALIPSGGLVALGTIIFWCGGKHIVPKKDETKRSLTTPGMPSIPFGIALICSLLLLI